MNCDRSVRWFGPFWALLASLLIVLLLLPVDGIGAASQDAILSSGQGHAPVGFRQPSSLNIGYLGSKDLVEELQSGATPKSMSAADFNADGAMDLVMGYSTARGGIVALLLGNPDAYAPADPALYKAAAAGNLPPTFAGKARVFALTEEPDFLAAGDFNGDGKKDVLVAANNGALYFLAGDGHGILQAPVRVDLPGQVTALAVNDGGQVAVGIAGGSAPELLVLNPAHYGFSHPVASYPVTAPVTTLAWGSLGSGTGADLAVGVGDKLMFIYDALDRQASIEVVQVPFQVRALVLGDFVWDRLGRTEVAVLGDDGGIHLLQHGVLDTRPMTASDAPRRSALPHSSPSQSVQTVFRPADLGAWTIAANPLSAALPSRVESAGRPFLLSPRLTPSPTHDLMTVDADRNQVTIYDSARDPIGNGGSPSASLKFSSTPVAAYALPQKLNGQRDLVVMISGQVAPMLVQPAGAQTINVNTILDTDLQNACGNSAILPGNLFGLISLREATCAANNYGSAGAVTINVPSGIYALTLLSTGELQLGKTAGANISIVGTGTAANTIILQTDLVDRVFECDPNIVGNVTTSISNVTISGGTDDNFDAGFGGAGVLAGGPGDLATFTNVVISGNTTVPDSDGGGGIGFSGGGSLVVINSTILNNVATQSLAGGIGFFNGPGSAGNLTVTNSTFTGNGATAGEGTPQGGGLFSLVETGFSGTVTGSTFFGNGTTGTGQGGGIYSQGPLTVSNSRMAGNIAGAGGKGIYASGAIYGSAATATGINNWWGCNAGPGNTGCDTVGGDTSASVTFSPWLVLKITASPTTVAPLTGTSTLTADLTHNSNGTSGFSVPNGTVIGFGGTLGVVLPLTNTTSSGQATSIFTAGIVPGSATGTATLDGQTVSAAIAIGVVPSFTSLPGTTFKVGTASTFVVTTLGSPTPAIVVSGTLPSGVTFVDNGNGTGTLSGTPAAATGGSYSITFTASNVAGSTPQSFTLLVDQPPAITSAASAAFVVGTAGSFNIITSSGYPASDTIVSVGILPAGVTFTDNGNGTATLAGTPAAGTAGAYPILITVSNGVLPNATQTFTLNVDQAPSITSASSTTFVTGILGAFTVITTGFPANAAITKLGNLPAGVLFTDNGNGTATLGGIPALATGGTYPITITANNGVTPNATQSFTLTVDQPPAITSANNTAFVVGTAGSFSVTTSGVPANATLSKTGILPSGVTFTNNGNGTATLAGTPAAGTAGIYPLVFTAGNGVLPNGTQAFNLTVNQAPAITSSASATFAVGVLGTFVVTTTGFPANPAISKSGALPNGVTLTDNGNGTATLAGIPAAATGGTYSFTITANNGVPPNATQNFTLTVDQAPTITSGASASFLLGSAGTFTITTSGFPVNAVITKTGLLPAGVTFTDNGNGTATLSGTASSGTAGVYAIALSANNGVAPIATQSFTLTVNLTPTITSASNATFVAGTPGTFTVTTSSFPLNPAISENGALPSGITFSDNHNGTATIAGTPAVGAGAAYPITITANNGIPPNGTQNFTLTVDQAPAITSGAGATFAVGTVGSFSVTTSGFPTNSITKTGALPGGVTFSDNGNGTATLAGTPATGSGGSYPITITATNGVIPNASQNFTLTVNQSPAITSAGSATFVLGSLGMFTVTTSGIPANAAISKTGALPRALTSRTTGMVLPLSLERPPGGPVERIPSPSPPTTACRPMPRRALPSR